LVQNLKMKLNLYIDKTNEFNPKGAVFFQDDNAYFDIIIKVYAALKSNSDLTIICRLTSLKELIKNAFSPYEKIEIIEHKEITFKTLLKTKWNISVFDFEPSDKEILDQHLLNLDFGTEKPESFSTILISNLVSPYLSDDTIPAKKFGNLVNDLNKYSQSASDLPPIVKKVLNYKYSFLTKLKKCSDELLNLIFNSPIELYENACQFSLIKEYPLAFIIKVQDQKWNNLFKGFSLKDLELSDYLEKSLLFQNLKGELSIYFSSIKDGITDEILDNIIDSVSGYLIEEFDFFIEVLSSHNEVINQSRIKKLASKFSVLDSTILGRLFEIEDKIKPTFELPPFNPDEDFEKILDNAINYYYPYKIWSDNSECFDEKVMDWGIKFSEFILEEYEQISYHYENCIFRFIHNNISFIKETDLSIFLIVDNLNYNYFRYLKEEFNNFNIILPKEPSPYLSLLPTTTSVGKFSIISGKRDRIDSSIINYSSLITSTWEEYFPDHSLLYFHSDLAELIKHSVKGKEIIFINFLGVDDELHSSPKKTLINHKENIRFILKKLTSILNQFIKRNRMEDNAKIFFISDHGSTQILESYPNPIIEVNISAILPGEVISEDHRFIKVQKNDLKELQSNVNITKVLFCLNDKISGDGNNYVIAKGYGRFKKSISDSYIHGGATPEEMIIPGGYFIYQTSGFKDIIVQLLKTEYRYLALETFTLRLANPNDKRIEKIQFEIFENDTPKIKLYENDDIDPKSEIQIEPKFKVNKKEKSIIRISINYTIESVKMSVEKEFPIKVKSIVETNLDMENLLNI